MTPRTIVGVGAAGLLLTVLAAPAAGSAPPGAGALTLAQAQALLARLPGADDPGPAELVNDEVAVAHLDPTGLPEHALLISRVTATGPAREVVDPASQTNVRYLDRLGRPEVTPQGVLLTVGGSDPSALTQARFDIPLPVALHVEYALDGTVVPAGAVPGAAGELAVTYTLTSTDVEQTALEYVDAAGVPQTTTRPVLPPFQGTLTVTLPRDAELLGAGNAVQATDTDGRTVLQWMVSLYPPISSPIQAFTVTMRADRAAIPGADVVLAPVVTAQDPSDQFSADLLAGTTQGNEELYRGLTELDAGAAALATGSGRLAGGLDRLAGGADEVASASNALARGVGVLAGGAGQLAGASAGLASGVDELADGADALATGSAQLSGALDRAVDGADELARATAALAAATAGGGPDPVAPLLSAGEQIEAGLLSAAARVGGPSDAVLDPLDPLPPDGDDVCPAGGTAPPDDDCVTIYQGVRLLRDGLVTLNEVADAIHAQADRAQELVSELVADLGSIRDDVTTAAEGAAALYASLCAPATPTLDPESCAQLKEVADAAADALATGAGAAPTLKELIAAITALRAQGQAVAAALSAALTSTQRLLDGVEALGLALGPGTATQPGLSAAMSALNDGLRQLSAGLSASQAQLAAALAEVATGNATLAAGLGSAAAGASDLATGSRTVAGGAQAAASGAHELSGGAEALATGADGAASGAGALAAGAEGMAEGTRAAAGAGGDVATGARALQQEGTEPAADAVLTASTDPALAQAWLAAADARAADALPYGAPEGAVGNAAYRFTLDPVSAPLSLWERIRGMFD